MFQKKVNDDKIASTSVKRERKGVSPIGPWRLREKIGRKGREKKNN